MAVTLVGNWSWTVWLLIPTAVVLAALTAVALGSYGEPDASVRRTRGVGRALARAADDVARR